ncbi:MAG: ATP-binding protein [Myxococcota bacterium]
MSSDYEQPPDDDERVRELMTYDVLDTPPEEMYDELVRVASRMLDMPIALVSLVDKDRQWFKAKVGLDADQTPRGISFCTHAILEKTVFQVPNALEDPRFAGSPLVTGAPFIRSYYGAPLQTPRGHALGTLCVIDRKPRVLSADACELLEVLARQVARALELRRAGLEARQAAQAELQAKQTQGAFLASMSHELRTPLSAIIGFSSILRRNKHGNLASHDLDYLERISANGDYLLRLVNDILDLSKVEAGRMEVECQPLELVPLVKSILVELEGRESKVPLVFHSPSTPLQPVVADPHRLRQVIINLVVNAMKFTEEGGIEVRIIVGDGDTPLRLDVVDSGIGIPPEEQDKIFERHGQASATQKQAGSWGLGLFLSRRLCELMGISMQVASEVGMGTTFALMLTKDAPKPVHQPPRVLCDTSSPSVEPACLADESFAGKTVLVVDDDADARAILESYVQDFGCRVIAVDSGEQALEIAQQIRPDLITLDLMMPGLDGWGVLQALREDPKLAQIPVAVCSMADIAEKSALPDVIMLDKPVDRRRFRDALGQSLQDDLRETILIVETDPDRSQAVSRWVSSAGGIPRVVGTELQAKHALRDHKPSLVLLGPCAQTYPLLNHLRNSGTPDAPPVALYGFLPGEETSLDTGVQVVLQQPGLVDIKTLLADRLGPTST